MKSVFFVCVLTFVLIQISFTILTEVFLCSGLTFACQSMFLTRYGLCHFGLETVNINE
jgi:hypothetical protein